MTTTDATDQPTGAQPESVVNNTDALEVKDTGKRPAGEPTPSSTPKRVKTENETFAADVSFGGAEDDGLLASMDIDYSTVEQPPPQLVTSTAVAPNTA